MMKALSLLFCCSLLVPPASAQRKFQADKGSLFASRVVEGLPEGSVYFIGQLHNNTANTLLEKELLFHLNSQYGVTCDIIEYSHSAAFILNEYLQTGHDSLLALINSKAPFAFVRSIRQFNDRVTAERKIRFYGIDFEGREGGRITRKALSLISDHLADADNALNELLKACVYADSTALPVRLDKLRLYLQQHTQEARTALKNTYLDLWLIANAQYGFSPNRDKAMFNNFKFLYEELNVRNTRQSRFFGSFGTGHINPDNRGGIASILHTSKNSPVKEKVVVLGVQYLNCYFNTANTLVTSYGSLDFFCNQKAIAALAGGVQGDKSLQYIPASELQQTACGKKASGLAGLIIIEHFPATSYYIWE